MAPNNKDPLGKQLPLRAAMAQSRWTLSANTRKDPALQGQERHKPHRLHPRQLDINGAAAPVQTTVASYINVVLDSDGTSIGNVLVPAESTVFSVDGYGPITLDNYNPPNPTPASSRPTSRSHGHSHAAQQTMQPESQETQEQQGSPNAAASPSSPTPMTIQVPGSSSQAILSSPPTPLPPNPSSSTNSSSSLTASESYFGSTSSQTSSAPDTASPQTTGTAFAPQGNSTTSFVTSSQTVSGSTLVTTFPVTFTPTSNSTSYSSSFSDTLLTTSSSLNQTSASSTSAASTNSRSTTSSLPFSTSASSTSSSSPIASSTFSDTGVPGGGGGTPTGTGSGNPSSSTTAASGSGGGGTPSTPTLVGSVVGGLAGLALILILILFLFRRRKQLGRRRTISPPIPQSASTGPGATSGTMTERSSAAVPLASAAFFRRLRPGSGATATTTETTPSERGFQNLGGRKLESVLSSRGDGYGDVPFGAAGTSTAPGPSSARGQPPPSIPIVTGAPGAAPGHSSPESLSGSSFYRDSQGFYGGPGQGQAGPEPASNSSSMFVGPASPPQSPTHPSSGMPQGQEGIAVMRPGPARTPLTTQGGLSPMRGPPARGTPPPHIPGTIQERPRDGLGRSHPSMDGSRGSRFAENI